jgi:hypothetical protein
MIRHHQEIQVHRSVGEVFDFVATNSYDNHPRWEREVVEIRRITDGPIRVGSRAVMVRREFGRTSETEYEVTELEHNRRIAFQHCTPQMDFDIAFTFLPEGEATRLAVDVQAQPHGALRLNSPLMRFQMPRTGRRIMKQLRELLEEPAISPAAAGTG